MKGEINKLLDIIERGHIALKQAYMMSHATRVYFIQEQERMIDTAYNSLLELCGQKAHTYVRYSLQWADLMYQIRQARAYIQRRIYEHRVICTETIKMERIA